MQPATRGEMTYRGKPWQPHNMIESQHEGISMILQEANTIPGVTVAQNLFAGREAEFSKCGIVNMGRMYKAAEALLKKFGITHIHARDRIDSLTFEDRKLTEVVRLEGREILYKLIRKMAKEDKVVVFISHDMDEIL